MAKKISTRQQAQDRCEKLMGQLSRAMESPALTYGEITRIKDQGLYLISDRNKIIYVGKTGRSGQERMRELAADFRSHTLNRKLLRDHLRKRGLELSGSAATIKQKLIEAALVTEAEFRDHQATINAHIRDKFIFRFAAIADVAELGRLEYFAIALLDPIYND